MSKVIINKLFPYNALQNRLKIDTDSIYYISTPRHADKITKLLLKFLLDNNYNINNQIIVDGTAGVGGNTISFGKYNIFKYIISVELDPTRFKYLVNNTSIYRLNNVKCYNENCLNVINNIKKNIVFFDPPWGGREYKSVKKLRINLGPFEIENICIGVFNTVNRPEIICMKLPNNYDIRYLYNKLKNISKIYLYQLEKFKFVILEYNNNQELLNNKLIKIK